MSVVLFLDANQYLNFYRLIAGKRLLDSLEEQKAYIFVSNQIVDEVVRNKLRVATFFFSQQFKDIRDMGVPDHLLGVGDERTTEIRKTLDQSRKARSELIELAGDTLSRISRSDDEVSQRLNALFDKAVSPNADEIKRAGERRERGNPPGKSNDPLGDQLTWEQFLTHCKRGGSNRLWIVTNDEDFGTKWERRFFLNPLLIQDLIGACGADVEARCFDNLADGIADFGKNAGVTAKKQPTDQEAAEIKKEIDTLPPIGWMSAYDDATMAVIRNHQFRQGFVAALGVSAGTTPIVLSSPDAKRAP